MGLVNQDTLQCLNQWKVFENRGLHFIYHHINSLLSKSRGNLLYHEIY